MSLTTRNATVPSLAPLDNGVFGTGADSVGATLQLQGFSDCMEAMPQCDSATGSCPMQQA